jgi:pimeloyl-ACP methyl ester carboxylesterase
MKKLLICVFTFCFITQLKAQDITGSWQGSMPAGNRSLYLVFNITKTGANIYISTFDSPDQKAFGIPCSKINIAKDSLFIEIANAGITYKGLWNGNADITGTFRQSGKDLPLNLKLMLRPQTPKPPFDYVSEDVEYDNADKSVHYGATFSRPKENGKYPAVIIITGSGTQDRDGTLFGHKLYAVLADFLTKNGIAILRVDDRGAGKSTLGSNFKNVTSMDLSYDVETSLNYLETRPDVNKKHLGLIGHSEGGIIAPMVAARRKDVSFIVMWGAPETGGAKLNTEQNAYQLKKSGIDSLAINAFSSLHRQVLALFASSANLEALDAQINPVFDAWKKEQDQKILDALYVKNNSIVGQDVFSMYNGLYKIPWMRFFIAYDPEKDLSKVKCLVLAINGEKDTQVDATRNLGLIKEILTKSGNKDFETKALPGLNHLLQTAQTGDLSEYEKIDETMSPVAMKIISDWIKIHTK